MLPGNEGNQGRAKGDFGTIGVPPMPAEEGRYTVTNDDEKHDRRDFERYYRIKSDSKKA